MSVQGHKEWRFIIYTVPCITIMAANGIRNYSKITAIRYISVIGILITFLTSLINVYISSLNYPGGNALQEMNRIILDKYGDQSNVQERQDITVHMDIYPCMTGITKLGYIREEKVPKSINLVYDKTETYSKLNDIWPTFDYYISNIKLDAGFISRNNEMNVRKKV